MTTYISHVLSNLHLVERNWDFVSQQPQSLCIPIQVVFAMPFKVGRLKTLQYMKGCFLQYSSWQFFLCWFINILQTASVPAHGGNIILFDYHCFCWFQISEFNVSGNPVFRDRSIQGESVGPEIPLRPSLPNFTLVQEMSQQFTSALKILAFMGEKLTWNEAYPHSLVQRILRAFLSARYLLIASPHHYWVFLLLSEMQQKHMICRIVCPKSWADYSILI
jgi:hypothetical protein